MRRARLAVAGFQSADPAVALRPCGALPAGAQRASTDEGLGAFRIFALLLNQFRRSS
jgi:hypothetical protein